MEASRLTEQITREAVERLYKAMYRETLPGHRFPVLLWLKLADEASGTLSPSTWWPLAGVAA